MNISRTWWEHNENHMQHIQGKQRSLKVKSKRSGPLACMLPDLIGCSEFSILGHFFNHFGLRHVVGV